MAKGSRRENGSGQGREQMGPVDLTGLSAQLQELGREVARFVPDALAMLRGVLADPRVPHSAKVEAGLSDMDPERRHRRISSRYWPGGAPKAARKLRLQWLSLVKPCA